MNAATPRRAPVPRVPNGATVALVRCSHGACPRTSCPEVDGPASPAELVDEEVELGVVAAAVTGEAGNPGLAQDLQVDACLGVDDEPSLAVVDVGASANSAAQIAVERWWRVRPSVKPGSGPRAGCRGRRCGRHHAACWSRPCKRGQTRCMSTVDTASVPADLTSAPSDVPPPDQRGDRR